MSIKIPITSPLTKSQSELTSKISSMKGLLSLPPELQFNIPESEQISTYDYLMKLLKTMGVDPEIMFNFFLDKVFSETGDFLEEKVISAVADSIGEKGISLPSLKKLSATDEEKKEYKKTNRNYLMGLVPIMFLQTAKQQIAKNLTVMVFGPRTGGASDILCPNPSERERLFKEAVCGVNLFNIHSQPIIREQDVEYSRIALKKQLELGQVIFEVNCQDVKVMLPEDPSYIFEGGGKFTNQSTLPPTPAQSLSILVQHVKNQGQRINNEQNSNSIGHSFFEILIGKLLNYMSSLLFPFLGPIFDFIPQNAATSSLSPATVAYSNCDIMNSSGNPAESPKEKNEFMKSLANALLKELLRVLLVFAIKKFKVLVANYFAKTSLERQKRKAEKIKQKYAIFNDKLGRGIESASKAKKYAVAISKLSSVLEGVVQVNS